VTQGDVYTMHVKRIAFKIPGIHSIHFQIFDV
jgi:hypothetical protein